MSLLSDKAKTEWVKIAKENIEVKEISGTLYAFGSELATLRLYYAFRTCGDRASTKYSKAYDSWVFSLETC